MTDTAARALAEWAVGLRHDPIVTSILD